MKIDVQFLQKRSDGRYRYRRVVPQELRAAIGKSNILIALGRDEAKALRTYHKAHADAEETLRRARASLSRNTSTHDGTPSPLEQFRHGQRYVRDLGLDPDWSGPAGDENGSDDDDDETLHREVMADAIAAKYPVDDVGRPLGISRRDAAVLGALMLGAREQRPEPTLDDARKLYLKEKVRDDDKKRMELDRVFQLVRTALGKDRTLRSLRREDAKEVRDHMLDGRKPSSVDRYLNTVRAVINHAAREYDLAGYRNPFIDLEAAPKDQAEPDRDARRSFTMSELKAVNERIGHAARGDLRLIWRMLQGTGCRLAEIAGLRLADVHHDHATPHITVEWHDERRIKNKVSRRNVPLIGDTLAAAKEAVEEAEGGVMLFPAYGRKGGPSSASAALSKHIRTCVDDPKVTTHSLRHLMKDRLRLAGVSKADQDIVLGHSSGSVGEDYGGDGARLEVARRALEKALAVDVPDA